MDENFGAVEDLEQALISATTARNLNEAIRRSRDSQLLNAFVAACLEDRNDADSTKAFRALEAAETAWSFDQAPAIGWNRSLALEHLQLREEAAAAWRDYLRVERDPKWRTEAAGHLKGTASPTETALWPAVQQALTAAPAGYVVHDAATRFPQQLRTWIEEELLVNWGRLTLSGRANQAASVLARTQVSAAALADAGGDPMSRDVVEILNAASPSTRRLAALGFERYGEGLAKYRRGEASRAISAFRMAKSAFDRIHCPTAALASVRLASCDYYSNDYETVDVDVTNIRGTYIGLLTKYPALAGQVDWLAGLESLARGRADESYARYARSLHLFQGLRESENVGAIHDLMAENRAWVGSTEDAARHRLDALQALSVSGSWRRGASTLSGMAEAATLIGANRAARRFISKAIENAARNGNAELAGHGCLWQAVIDHRQGAADSARHDLADAHEWALRIVDSAVRARFDADSATVEGQIVSVSEPGLSKRLDRAIGFYEAARNNFLLAQCLIVRADRSTDRNSAVRDYRRALALTDRAGYSIADAWERATFYGSFDSAAARLVDLLLEHDDVIAALETADATRSRVLSQLLTRRAGTERATNPKTATLDARAMSAMLPLDTVVVEFAVRDDSLVAWVLMRRSVTVRRLAVGRLWLEESLARLRTELSEPMDSRAAWRDTSAELFDRLFRPLEAAMGMPARIIVVPDATLENLPFAAVYDRVSRKFLIERAEVDLIPAAAFLRRHRRSSSSRAAMFGDPAFDPSIFDNLPRLEGARREVTQVASFYERPEVFTGKAATKSAFLDALPRADVVHFSGHGISASARPAASRLIFAAGGKGDGAVYPGDIIAAGTRARAIILSACGTGVSAPRWSHGVSSVSKAFVAAGASAVAATLWDINDESAVALFRLVHQRLVAGARLGTASRDAVRDAIRNRQVPASTWASLQV
ncbi:MAG TPA: CHAT domain-containing protein, partial [Thermoanaerobaculia bacterium]|nr:CHAT domain-containing protein [Thermoanaerobaculia bacterium]